MDPEQQELQAACALLELNQHVHFSAKSSYESRLLPKWGATGKRRRYQEQLPPAPAQVSVEAQTFAFQQQRHQQLETSNSPTSPRSWSSPSVAAWPPQVKFEIRAQFSALQQQQKQQASSLSPQQPRKRNDTRGKNTKKPKREDVKVLYQKFQGLSDENACLKEQKAQMDVKMQTLRAEQASLKQELKKHCSLKARPGSREETGNGNVKDEGGRYLLPDLNIKLPDPFEDDENFTEPPVSTMLTDCQNPILELSVRRLHAAEARKQRMVYLRSKVSANHGKKLSFILGPPGRSSVFYFCDSGRNNNFKL